MADVDAEDEIRLQTVIFTGMLIDGPVDDEIDADDSNGSSAFRSES